MAGRRGPHVTPVAFDVEDHRLWFITPRRSFKVEALTRRRRVGGLVRVGERAVVLSGRARVVDPLTGRGVLSAGRLLDLPFAAAGYLGRNYRHATGTLRDHQAPTLALSRVAVAVDVTRVALLDGTEVVAAWGRWARVDRLVPGPPPGPSPPDLESVPPRLRRLFGDGAPVVLGWESPAGPLALPARWRAEPGVAETSPAALALAGAPPAGPASLTAERSRYRLKHKEGVLVAGEGRAGLHGGAAWAAVPGNRITWWVGEESRTVVTGRP